MLPWNRNSVNDNIGTSLNFSSFYHVMGGISTWYANAIGNWGIIDSSEICVLRYQQ